MHCATLPPLLNIFFVALSPFDQNGSGDTYGHFLILNQHIPSPHPPCIELGSLLSYLCDQIGPKNPQVFCQNFGGVLVLVVIVIMVRSGSYFILLFSWSVEQNSRVWNRSDHHYCQMLMIFSKRSFVIGHKSLKKTM